MQIAVNKENGIVALGVRLALLLLCHSGFSAQPTLHEAYVGWLYKDRQDTRTVALGMPWVGLQRYHLGKDF